MSTPTTTPTTANINKLSPEEIKLRGSLLAKNKELLKLHKELVSSRILTEEEFWEDRRGLLRVQEMILKQKKGITSSLVADDLKPAASNSSSDVKYVLTPTIIQTIFEQHQILKKAFTDLVVNEKTLTERDFWIEYFKSKFFNEQQKSTNTESVHLDPYYQETMSKSTESNESKVKVSSLLDISRSEEDHVSDYLRYEREAAANDPSWNSLRQFNKHSLRVLQALKHSESESLASDSSLYIEIPDLKSVPEPEMVALNVQESQLFSKEKGQVNTNSVEHVPVKNSYFKEIFGKSSNFDATRQKLNYQQSKEVFSQIYNRNSFKVAEADENISRLNSALTDEETNLLNSSIEILRHFWKTVTGTLTPAKLTPEKIAKLTRFITVLEATEEKLKNNKGHNGFDNLKEVIHKAKLKYSELVK